MIDIIYVQSNASHPAGFTCTVTDQSNDWWLITMTHTPAYHIIDGKRIIMPAHSITLYPPYSSMEYGSLENEIFCADWLRFYTDEPFICNGSVPLGTPFKAMDHSYISSLIHLIAVENFFQNQYKNFTVQSLFQILFSKLKESLSYNKSSTFHEIGLICNLFTVRDSLFTNKEKLNSSSFRRTTTIVRQRRNIDNLGYFDTSAMYSSHSRFTTVSGTFYIGLYFPQT